MVKNSRGTNEHQDTAARYRDGDTVLEAHVAWDEAVTGPRPGVLVSHAWAGRGEFEDRKANSSLNWAMLASRSIYTERASTAAGLRKTPRLMQPLLDDRTVLQKRMGVALEQLTSLSMVDSDRLAAIGFCFGGLCVLDLAQWKRKLLESSVFTGCCPHRKYGR